MTDTPKNPAAPWSRREKLLLIGVLAVAAWNLWLGSRVDDVVVKAEVALDDARRAMNRANDAHDLAEGRR